MHRNDVNFLFLTNVLRTCEMLMMGKLGTGCVETILSVKLFCKSKIIPKQTV